MSLRAFRFGVGLAASNDLFKSEATLTSFCYVYHQLDTLGDKSRNSEAGSYLRLIDSCITQLKAQGPSRSCNESKEEDSGAICQETNLRNVCMLAKEAWLIGPAPD